MSIDEEIGRNAAREGDRRISHALDNFRRSVNNSQLH
jgi:hypothetical protein